MFSRQEASQLIKEFWTVFGKYMLPVPSAEGGSVNWINYKTGVKNIRFHMQADESNATVAIELDHKDPELRESAIQKFRLSNDELQQLPGIWGWEKAEEKDTDLFITRLSSVHIIRKTDWPQMITFLKSAIVALDMFWVNNKDIFES